MANKEVQKVCSNIYLHGCIGGIFVFSQLAEQLQHYRLYITHTHTRQMPTALCQQSVNIVFCIACLKYVPFIIVFLAFIPTFPFIQAKLIKMEVSSILCLSPHLFYSDPRAKTCVYTSQQIPFT